MKIPELTDIFETERLILKIPQVSEAQALYGLIDDSTHKYMVWEKWDDYKDAEKNLIETREEAKMWKSWQAALYLKDWETIGRFWMHTLNEQNSSVCLGYWIGSQYRWNWYIPECVEYIKEYAFTKMWLNKITIRCVKENLASRKVAEKCWFTLDWIIRHDELQKWKYVDNCYYSFLKKDYIK